MRKRTKHLERARARVEQKLDRLEEKFRIEQKLDRLEEKLNGLSPALLNIQREINQTHNYNWRPPNTEAFPLAPKHEWVDEQFFIGEAAAFDDELRAWLKERNFIGRIRYRKPNQQESQTRTLYTRQATLHTDYFITYDLDRQEPRSFRYNRVTAFERIR